MKPTFTLVIALVAPFAGALIAAQRHRCSHPGRTSPEALTSTVGDDGQAFYLEASSDVDRVEVGESREKAYAYAHLLTNHHDTNVLVARWRDAEIGVEKIRPRKCAKVRHVRDTGPVKREGSRVEYGHTVVQSRLNAALYVQGDNERKDASRPRTDRPFAETAVAASVEDSTGKEIDVDVEIATELFSLGGGRAGYQVRYRATNWGDAVTLDLSALEAAWAETTLEKKAGAEGPFEYGKHTKKLNVFDIKHLEDLYPANASSFVGVPVERHLAVVDRRAIEKETIAVAVYLNSLNDKGFALRVRRVPIAIYSDVGTLEKARGLVNPLVMVRVDAGVPVKTTQGPGK